MTGPQDATPSPGHPVTPDPVTPDPVTPDPVTPDPVTPDPVTPDPVTPDPVTPQPAPAPVETETDSDDPGVADEPAAAAGRRAWLPLAAVGAAVALLTAGTGTLAWQLRQQSEAELARDEAIAAARDAARLLFSYDHTTLDDDFAAGLAVTTGGFREQYSRTTVEVVRPVAEQYDAVVEAEVIQTAVVDASPSSVTALVFLNQATTSTRVQGQQVDQSRVRMRLVDRGGEWLVEDVRAL